MLMAGEWQGRQAGLAATVRGAVLASGLFDLRPLPHVDAQAWLQLDEPRARHLSPMLHLPASGSRLVVLAAEADTDEFKRQSQDYARLCAAAGCEVTDFVVPGRNHFDVVMEWTDPDSLLFRATMALF